MTRDATLSVVIQRLRQKWEENPTHALVFQLADEYSRIERFDLAAEVLQKQVDEHPQHFSARVALGRCRLELEETREAVVVLEPVVAEDPTHLVANKLLAKAYLSLQEASKARDRLDLYVLLADSDWEIDELERQLRYLEEGALSKVQEFQEELSVEVPSDAEQIEAEALTRDEAQPEEFTSEVVEPYEFDTIDDLGDDGQSGAVDPQAAANQIDAIATDLLSQETPREPGVSMGEDSLSTTISVVKRSNSKDQPFEAQASQLRMLARRRLLASGGVFSFAPPERVFVANDSSSLRNESGDNELEKQLQETATLGNLYLQQGHRAEARRIFREILIREPGNASASHGMRTLDELASKRLAARDLLEGNSERFSPTSTRSQSSKTSPGIASLKAQVLQKYLSRVRAKERSLKSG